MNPVSTPHEPCPQNAAHGTHEWYQGGVLRRQCPGAQVDTDSITPTQDLILEVLAARHRLGEHLWSVDRRHLRTLRQLEQAGLVGWRHGPRREAVRAWLTDTGERAYLDANYVPPRDRPKPPQAETLQRLLHAHGVNQPGDLAGQILELLNERSHPVTPPPARVGVITWDWKEQPSILDLAQIIHDLSDGRIHLTQITDTGSDQHAVVVSTVPVDQATAQQVFKRWWVSEDRADVFPLDEQPEVPRG